MINLNSKQRARLRAMASEQSPIMQIGKDGITENLVKTVADALEARELIKLSVLETCATDVKAAANELAEATDSTVVCTIGRKLVLYRESENHKRIEL